MSNTPKLNRRAFVAAQACAVLAGASGLAGASILGSAPSWETATKKELSPLIGDRFTATTMDGLHVDLKLIAAEACCSGPARPAHLARREGVMAVFKSPQASKIALSGHQTVRIKHASLGKFDLFIGAVPSRSGGHVLEAILN